MRRALRIAAAATLILISACSKKETGSDLPAAVASRWTNVDDYQLSKGMDATANAMTEDAAGNLYVAGEAINSLGMTVGVIRKSTDGGTTWTDYVNNWQLVSTEDATIHGLAFNASGELIAVGQAKDASNASFWHVTRVTGANAVTTLDSRDYGNHVNSADGIVKDPSGTLYVLGEMLNGAGQTIMAVRKSADGGSTWTYSSNTYVYTSGAYASAIACDSAGTVFTAGYGNSGLDSRWLVRRFNGAWSSVDVYPSDESVKSASANGITIAADQSIYVVGNSSDGSSESALIRKSADGESWAEVDRFQLSTGKDAAAVGVALEGRNIYVVGVATDSASTFHWFVRKLADGSSWVTDDDYQLAEGKRAAALGTFVTKTGNVFVYGTAADANDKFHWIVRKLAPAP